MRALKLTKKKQSLDIYSIYSSFRCAHGVIDLKIADNNVDDNIAQVDHLTAGTSHIFNQIK